MVVSFTCWVIGSGSNKALLQRVEYFTCFGKCVRPYTVPSENLFFFTLPLLRLTVTFYYFFFLSQEVPTMNRLGVNSWDSTLALKEKCPTLLLGPFFPRSFFLCCPHSLKPRNNGAELEKRDQKCAGPYFKEGHRPVWSLFRRERLVPPVAENVNHLQSSTLWGLP